MKISRKKIEAVLKTLAFGFVCIVLTVAPWIILERLDVQVNFIIVYVVDSIIVICFIWYGIR